MQRETDTVKKHKYYKILLIILTQVVAILMESKTDINHHTNLQLLKVISILFLPSQIPFSLTLAYRCIANIKIILSTYTKALHIIRVRKA